jgi:hypothetical protein
MTTSFSDSAIVTEKALLGTILAFNSVWPQASELSADDFILDSHRRIYASMAALFEDKTGVDVVTLQTALSERNQLEKCGGIPYLSELLDNGLPENFQAYVRGVRKASQERRYGKQKEHFNKATSTEERLVLLEQMRGTLTGRNQADDWRGLFHSFEECESAPPLQFAIKGFLQEAGITLIGGLAGHGKTFVMLSMVRALLEASPLFGYEPFKVPHEAKRVLYLIPESSLGPFWSRIKLFHLEDYVRSERLLISTLSSKGQVSLKDLRLLKAAEGGDVFLDTAVRFMEGAENDAENSRVFADTLFRLLAAGTRTIVGAHHSPKGFEGQDYMTLENILRGSTDIGAMLCTCWGIRQINADSNQIYVANVKPRDFQPCEPFILEGRPHLDRNGQFAMIRLPGEAGELREYVKNKGGAPAMADKDEKVRQVLEMKAAGNKSVRDMAKAVGVGKSTVQKWLNEILSADATSTRTVV